MASDMDQEAPPMATHPAAQAAPSDRVPFRQKLGMGLGTGHDMWGHWLYISLVYQVFNISLGVSPAWIGRALLCKLVFEALWDSVFGWCSDNARTRFGRRRPFILVGAVGAGIALPLLFAARPGWTQIEYFWFMVGSLAVFVPCMSCFYMPYLSLGAELTPDYHERTSLAAFRSACQKVPELTMFGAAAFTTAGVWVAATWSQIPARLLVLFRQTVEWMAQMLGAAFTLNFKRVGQLAQTLFGWAPTGSSETPNILLGAQVYTVILGGVMVAVGVLMFLLLKERYYAKLVVERKQERVSIKETLWTTLRCRPFRASLLMALAYGVGTNMVGTLGYYATVYYVCRGDLASAGTWNFWMGVANMVAGLCGIPVYAWVARRFGKKRAMMVVQVCAMAVFIATWWLYTPNTRWLQVCAAGLIAFTSAGFWMLYGSILADVMDCDELDTGKRREGAISACSSWIMKFGMGIAGWLSSEILARTGFDVALGGHQTPFALFMIRILLAAVPVVGLVVAFVFLARLGLTPGRMAEVRVELEARRGKA